jgi:hypothetical protein
MNETTAMVLAIAGHETTAIVLAIVVLATSLIAIVLDQNKVEEN